MSEAGGGVNRVGVDGVGEKGWGRGQHNGFWWGE